MKKILAATVVASLMATGAAFATAAPVLDIQEGQGHISADYNFDYKVALPDDVLALAAKAQNPELNGFTLAADYAVTDKVAVQVAGTRLKASEYVEPLTSEVDARANYLEFNTYYELSDNLNLFAGVQHLNIKADGLEISQGPNQSPSIIIPEKLISGTSVSVGAVMHTPIGEHATAFSKIAFANKNFERQVQIGVRYDINENLEVHAMYEHNRVDLHASDDLDEFLGSTSSLPIGIRNVDGPDLNGFSIGIGYRF